MTTKSFISPQTGVASSFTDTCRSTRDAAYTAMDTQLANNYLNGIIAGHSVVQGTGATDQTYTFANLTVGQLLSVAPSSTIFVDGHAGYTSTQLLGVVNAYPAPPTPWGLFALMAMLNDYLGNVAPTTTKSNLQAIIAKIKSLQSAPCSFVLLVEWLRRDVPPSGQTYPWSAYVAVAQQVADADSNVTVLDLGARLPDPSSDSYGVFSTDHVHPTNLGYALIAKNFVAELLRGRTTPILPPSTSLTAALPPSAQTGWSGVTRDSDNQFLRYSDGSQNDQISYQFIGAAGHYSIALDYRQQTNGGLYDLYLDGVLQGSGQQWDGYAAANGDAFAQLPAGGAGFQVTGNGLHTITLKMSSKNSSSSGYAGVFRGIYITRTGA